MLKADVFLFFVNKWKIRAFSVTLLMVYYKLGNARKQEGLRKHNRTV